MTEKVKAQLDLLIERYPQLAVCRDDIAKAYEIIETCYAHGGKLLIAGNGGSAADAEHIVGELMKGFKNPRKLPKEYADRLIAVNPELGKTLAENLQGALPAIALDGHPALSTARAKGMKIIGLTGQKESKLSEMADVCIRVPETDTYMVQELHLPVYHAICLMIEENVFGI